MCGIFLDRARTLSAWLYLLFGIWAIFLFLFFFSMLLGTNIFFLLHSPYVFAWWTRIVMPKGWSIFVWMKGMFLCNFQCRSWHEYMWSVRDLDLKSMKRISQGSQTIWQSSIQNKQHICELFKDMPKYGSGRNFISLRS